MRRTQYMYDRDELLLAAARKGSVEDVKIIIKYGGVYVDIEDEDKCTPLHLAAERGNKEVVEFLINKRADINKKDNDGHTPLHLAAAHGHEDVIKLLLDRGADVNAKDVAEQTSLHLAAAYNNKGAVELLLDRGADVNKKNQNGCTPLHLAALRSCIDVVESLLCKGADVSKKNDKGHTPLCLAVEKNCTEYTKTLIKYILLFHHEEAVPNFITENDALAEFWNQCKSKIKEMKEEKIYKNITFYDVLVISHNKLTSHIYTETAAQVLEGSGYRDKFSIYADNLERQSQIVRNRVDAMSVGEIVIGHLAPKKEKNLPSLGLNPATSEISGYLSNSDIVNLRKAAIQTMEGRTRGSCCIMS